MLTGTPKPGTCWIQLAIALRFDHAARRYVAGSPKLEVWSSGETPQEAARRADEAITLFIEEAASDGTIWQILREDGVEVFASQPETFEPPPSPDGDYWPFVFALSATSRDHCY